MFVKPLVVNIEGLQRIGVPYSRSTIWRLMQETITVSRKVPGTKIREKRIIPNPDKFPASHKANSHPNSPPLWRVKDVLAYLEAHGLTVTADWFDS